MFRTTEAKEPLAKWTAKTSGGFAKPCQKRTEGFDQPFAQWNGSDIAELGSKRIWWFSPAIEW